MQYAAHIIRLYIAALVILKCRYILRNLTKEDYYYYYCYYYYYYAPPPPFARASLGKVQETCAGPVFPALYEFPLPAVLRVVLS